MTDLNSHLNYSASLHYQQQQQQYQNSLQKLQANLKDKAVMNNDPNLLINIPLDSAQQHPQDQIPTGAGAPGAAAAGVNPNSSSAWNTNSNFNNNGLFSDTLSPFFAPYGIDVSHFPLTNPPIFESSMMMNHNGQPRRRISISNGQIGQITTHSINGEDLYDSQPPPLPKQSSQDVSNLTQQQQQQQQLLYNQLNLDSVAQNPATTSTSGGQVAPHLLGAPPQGAAQQPHQQVQIPPQQHQHQSSIHQQVTSHPSAVPPPQQIAAPVQQQQHTPNIKQEIPYQAGGSGIPNHKLVYNNEVIFNPDAGPIPGTAAWKKARLLERNRIAASKCRQRKKAAHIQLKEDVEKYQSQINRLKSEKRILFESFQYLKNLDLKNDKLDEVLSKLENITHPDKDDEETIEHEDEDDE